MMASLQIAATGMRAQQLNVEVVTNNLANMNTTGFKAARAHFADLLYQSRLPAGTTSSDAGTIVPTGIEVGLGVKTVGIGRLFEQGPLQNTGNKLDIAIQGRGFLVVERDGQQYYTRAGSLSLNETGQIVTPNGEQVLGTQNISLQATAVTINENGTIDVRMPDGTVEVGAGGQVLLAVFQNENGLAPVGNNLFLNTPASGDPQLVVPGEDGAGTILQGYLEGANVNTVSEITNLINAQRAYDMNSKGIQKSDEMLQTAINLVR